MKPIYIIEVRELKGPGSEWKPRTGQYHIVSNEAHADSVLDRLTGVSSGDYEYRVVEYIPKT